MLSLPILLALAASAPPVVPDARVLFLANCASCHGKEGAGDGTTKLDRPARSFKDGGFSYGNTEEALFRTLTYGIPGTPMPSFETSLSDDERRALATYVVSLGPPIEAVSVEETILVVNDLPVVVRGYLPPISETAQSHPRGLLIGHPSGLTFEYRVDDVRLLGVRQGAFVERKDWVGRGGAALQPLGRPVWLFDDGDPPPLFREDGKPLVAMLLGTDVYRQNARVRYELLSASGDQRARVLEATVPSSIPGTSGLLRLFVLETESEGLRLRAASWPGSELVKCFGAEPLQRWFVTRGPAGLQAIGLRTIEPARWTVDDGVLWLDVERGQTEVQVTHLSIPEWTPEVEAALRQESNR